MERSGLKVSSLYIAQVKQKHGIIERENYNKPKSDDARQPQCPLEKEKAIKEALKHFGMIKFNIRFGRQVYSRKRVDLPAFYALYSYNHMLSEFS